MRRTVLSALIVASVMVGTGTGVVAAFDAISDPHRQAAQRSDKSATAGIGTPRIPAPNAADPASVPPRPTTDASSPSDAPPADARSADDAAPEPDVARRTTGGLADTFTELGIDDPTTPDVDESAPSSPCTGLATVKAPVACVLR